MDDFKLTEQHKENLIRIIIVLVPLYILWLLFNALGWGWLIVGLSLYITVAAWHYGLKARWRKRALMVKYQNTTLVDAIMQGMFWEGQTAEQLREALGEPDEVIERSSLMFDETIWCYDRPGAQHYGIRITLVNGTVSRWDVKD